MQDTKTRQQIQSEALLDLKRLKVQNEAVEAWYTLPTRRGTVEAITGVGKNFMFIQCLHRLAEGIKVLFLAEQIDREFDVMQDIKKYDKIFDTDTHKNYDITFMTYQSAYKLKDTEWHFVCADEIHDSLSPAYSQFYFNNYYDYLLGLSATIIRSTKYEENGVEYTKGDLLDQIAPVCYRYTIDDGQRDGTSRKLSINVIPIELDRINKNVLAGNKTKQFYTTELESYQYWDKEFKKALFIQDEVKKLLKIRITSAARAKVLYRLPTKIQKIKKLLSTLKGKTLIFGNDLDTLLAITPNVVCSRYSDDKNKEIRSEFESGKINVIGSFKKLKQGANLSNLDNIIIMSYYSTTKDLIQRLGRLRIDGNKVGNVYIFVTKNTQEEVWFNKMFEEVNSLEIKKIEI